MKAYCTVYTVHANMSIEIMCLPPFFVTVSNKLNMQ